MKRALILFCVMLLLTSLASCRAPLPTDPRKSGFCAELCYETNGINVVCVLECEEQLAGEERDVSICFIFPVELSSVGVLRRNGEFFAVCGDEEIASRCGEAEALARTALLITVNGERSFVGRGTSDGEMRLHWTLTDGDKKAELVTDESGIPISLTQEDSRVKVTRFELTS